MMTGNLLYKRGIWSYWSTKSLSTYPVSAKVCTLRFVNLERESYTLTAGLMFYNFFLEPLNEKGVFVFEFLVFNPQEKFREHNPFPEFTSCCWLTQNLN